MASLSSLGKRIRLHLLELLGDINEDVRDSQCLLIAVIQRSLCGFNNQEIKLVKCIDVIKIWLRKEERKGEKIK